MMVGSRSGGGTSTGHRHVSKHAGRKGRTDAEVQMKECHLQWPLRRLILLLILG